MPPSPVRARVSGGADRLSALPDGVLHVILSFLPPPQMVRTTMLSRRWRDLWCSTPYINIDQPEFGIRINVREPIQEEVWAKFEDFTTNMLLFHCNTVSLDKFRLCAQSQHRRAVERWIRLGIRCCPRVLEILVRGVDRFPLQLPHLGSSSCRLERLYLSSVALDSRFAEGLCSRFSVLETLELVTCITSFENIASSTLKKLVLDSYEHQTEQPLAFLKKNLDEFPIYPITRTLSIGHCFLDDYDLNDKVEALGTFLQNAPCLEKVIIEYSMFIVDPDEEWDMKSITLRRDIKTFHCPKLKLIEIWYESGVDLRVTKLVWCLGRILPDASIKVSMYR
ncbi:MEIOTIC F-BOX protein MOF-like [Oryza brachyantha]|uniref:MEIOTIC F-BOX protein MOF-like n=1 Tax=Oryza brachyantha TaxID=4533 RepID=UPI001ADD21A8|nr:MEIOTIC F-BOX protein MOF-like [Oryza brachyantha]